MTGREVVLVVGPPGAGKSTWAESSGLLHLEREQFPSDGRFRTAVTAAVAVDGARVAVVRCCASQAEEDEWVRLIGATRVEVVSAPLETCLTRIEQRRRPRWVEEIDAARRWFQYRSSDNPAPVMGAVPVMGAGR
jgi:hypothetical protein